MEKKKREVIHTALENALLDEAIKIVSSQPKQEKPLGVNIVACLKKYCVLKENNFKFMLKKKKVQYFV